MRCATLYGLPLVRRSSLQQWLQVRLLYLQEPYQQLVDAHTMVPVLVEVGLLLKVVVSLLYVIEVCFPQLPEALALVAVVFELGV